MEPQCSKTSSNRSRRTSSGLATSNLFKSPESCTFQDGDARSTNKWQQASSRTQQAVPAWKLRNLANTPIGHSVLNRLLNAVTLQPWSIVPPHEHRHSQAAWERAQELSRAFMRPNCEDCDDYVLFTKAVLQDLIVLGYGAVERAVGSSKTQPFWLWEVNAAQVAKNPEWSPQRILHHPRYFFGNPFQPDSLIPLLDSELFLVRLKSNSHQLIPSSPFRVAYHLMSSWLGLNDYQDLQVGRAWRNQIITLVDATERDIQRFADYWTAEVEQSHGVSIVGKQVKIANIKAKNDLELFLKYEEKLLKLFAIAFNLTNQDLGVAEHNDEPAIVGAGVNKTFQEAILPYIQTLNRSFTENVTSYFEPGFEFKIETTQPLPEKQKTDTAKELYQGGIITLNESRLRAGMESIGPAGDFFIDGSSRG